MKLEKIYRGDENGWQKIDDNFQKLNMSSGEKLWNGMYKMMDTHVVTPKIPLKDCQNGWKLKWLSYNGSSAGEHYPTFTIIPKGFNEGVSAGTIAFPIPKIGHTTCFNKILKYSNTQIMGHGNNNVGENTNAVLAEVWSY